MVLPSGPPPLVPTSVASQSDATPFAAHDFDSMDVDDPTSFGLLHSQDAPTEEVDKDFFNDFPDDFDDEDLD